MPNPLPHDADVVPAGEQETDAPPEDGACPANSAPRADSARAPDPTRTWANVGSGDPSRRSREKLADSFGYAFSGLWCALRTQQNMRIHLSVAAAVVALGLYLGLDWMQWAVLVLTIGAVMIAEMFNTVAEAALDAATPYYHPLVKIAKDVAAGAVLLTAIMAVGVGLLVLGPPLWSQIANWLGR